MLSSLKIKVNFSPWDFIIMRFNLQRLNRQQMRSTRGMANLFEKRKTPSVQLKVEQRPCKAEYQNDEE